MRFLLGIRSMDLRGFRNTHPELMNIRRDAPCGKQREQYAKYK